MPFRKQSMPRYHHRKTYRLYRYPQPPKASTASWHSPSMPLLRKEVYQGLLDFHARSGAACTMLSGTCDEYLPYGRVLRDENGDFLRIVEDRDCTPEQKAIRELNVGIYAFDCKALLTSLDEIRNNNAQNEYYLTDVPAILRGKGQRVAVYTAELNEQILGVNTPEQLALTEKYLTRG